MPLPYGLHGDALVVVQGQGSDEVFRQLGVVFNVVSLHVPFDDRRVDLIVDVRAVEGLGFPFVEVGVNGLDAAGNAQHSRQGARRGDGQELGIAQALFLDQGRRLFRRVGLKEGRFHDFVNVAHVEGPSFAGQVRRGGDGRIGHGEADFIAQGDSFVAAIGDAQLDEHVAEAHDAQADLPPLAHAVLLFLQRMEGQAFVEDVVQSPHGDGHAASEFVEIKEGLVRKGIADEVRQVQAAQEARAAGRQGFFGAGIDAGKFKFLRIGQEIPLADAVPKQGARLGVVPVRFGNESEDVGGVDHAFDDLARFLPRVVQAELLAGLDGFHEFVA